MTRRYRDPECDYAVKVAEYEEKARMAIAALPDSVVFRLRLLIAAAEEEYKRKNS